jgi:hypothetical protein
LESKRAAHDRGLNLSRSCFSIFTDSRRHKAYQRVDKQTLLQGDDQDDEMGLMASEEEQIDLPPYSESTNSQQELHNGHPRAYSGRSISSRFQWLRTFSRQSNWILLTHTLVALHSMAFDSLFPVFLHLPELNTQDNTEGGIPSEDKTTGGFGMGMFNSTIFFFTTVQKQK